MYISADNMLKIMNYVCKDILLECVSQCLVFSSDRFLDVL